jgi:hypothetical protein
MPNGEVKSVVAIRLTESERRACEERITIGLSCRIEFASF